MSGPPVGRVLVWLSILSLSAACGAPAPTVRARVSAARPVGAWRGTGNRTVGDVTSDSGHLRIHWQTGREDPPGTGTFRLTVRSAVSGRPMQSLVDRRGEGRGTVDFEDTPRIYDFLVESAHVDWSFAVEEVYETYAEAPAGGSR